MIMQSNLPRELALQETVPYRVPLTGDNEPPFSAAI